MQHRQEQSNGGVVTQRNGYFNRQNGQHSPILKNHRQRPVLSPPQRPVVSLPNQPSAPLPKQASAPLPKQASAPRPKQASASPPKQVRFFEGAQSKPSVSQSPKPVQQQPSAQQSSFPKNENLYAGLNELELAVVSNDAKKLLVIAQRFANSPKDFALFYARISTNEQVALQFRGKTLIQIAYDLKLMDALAFLCKLSFALKKEKIIVFAAIHLRDEAILSCFKKHFRRETLASLNIALYANKSVLPTVREFDNPVIWQPTAEECFESTVHHKPVNVGFTFFQPQPIPEEQFECDEHFEENIDPTTLEFIEQLVDSEPTDQNHIGPARPSQALPKPATSS